ncbi:MAG: DUF2059 domain-containing protein [Kiloniellales bacterium]
MAKRVLLAVTVVLLTGASTLGSLRADTLDERRAVAQALMDEVVISQMNDQIVEAMLPLFRSGLEQQLAADGLAMPPEMMEQVEAIVSEETSLLMQRFMPEMIETYAQVLSLEELEALLAFYRTPAGASAMQKVPLLMQVIMPSLSKEVADLGPRLQQRLTDEVFEAIEN